MTHTVFITPLALAEIDANYVWRAERSVSAAVRWQASLYAAIESLQDNPERCPLAAEEEWYGHGLRQLLHGKKRQIFRILFEIRGELVVVLRVRHAAQDLLKPDTW